jgi:DNA invertase Pin-like site-specific DNA recombinase
MALTSGATSPRGAVANNRVIGYCRVSTAGQVTDGLGLPTQERLVRAWAKQHGSRLIRIVSENGRSGTLAEAQRPGLLEALEAVSAADATGIVVTSLDRLARALTVQEAVLGKVWALGGRVYTVDAGEVLDDDPDDPMRTAMRQMAGVFAQLERGLVVKRLRDGRATKRARGGFDGGGVPYGKRVDGAELVVDEVEAVIVARVKQLRAEGSSLREVCAVLEAEGFHPRRAERWHSDVVRRIADR